MSKDMQRRGDFHNHHYERLLESSQCKPNTRKPLSHPSLRVRGNSLATSFGFVRGRIQYPHA